MTSQSFQCPSCGANLAVENRFSKVVICRYCGQSSYISDSGLDPSGKKAKLADFPSIFRVGTTGTIEAQSFHVLGRLRYKYEGGFWDEWYLRVENQGFVWLQEDEGVFTAYTKTPLKTAIPSFEKIFVGTTLEINGISVFVTEKNEAFIAGGEGELHFKALPGQKARYVDGNSNGQLVSIEMTPDEICFNLGDEIPLNKIQLDDAER